MDREKVARAWVWSSLEDLFFGFIIEFEPHRPYKIFNEILSLEKILKALLLYYDGSKYETVNEEQSKKIIEKLARRYGHGIKKMVEKASNYLGKSAIDNLNSNDFDGFSGADLICALEAGYMESRYPTLKPIHEQFKIGVLDIYRDPLCSSGTTKFVYAINKLALLHLKLKLDLSSVKNRFKETYDHMEETQRFINLAFDGSLDLYL